jgi:predicted GNAT family acetyltransferase
MKFIQEETRIIALNDTNETMGYIGWKVLEDGVLNANHTFVDPTFRGQGVAQYLLKELVDYARKENKKIFATCSFVVKMFNHGDEYKDVIDPTRGIGDASCEIN